MDKRETIQIALVELFYQRVKARNEMIRQHLKGKTYTFNEKQIRSLLNKQNEICEIKHLIKEYSCGEANND